MNSIPSVRVALALLLFGGGLARAQGTHLPATQPTSGTPAAAFVSSPAPAVAETHRPEVTYSADQLQVTANNSSLNEILHQISRLTGMKITGGVADERVYGKYGPAPLGRVLASLLDGTGSNMILRETPQNTPGELILTPRNGGPTPPNPNAGRYDDDDPSPTRPVAMNGNSGAPARPVASPPAAQPTAPVEGVSSPAVTAAAPTTAPAPPPPGSGEPTPATNNTSSPNGVKTPQQIYQELQQLQQQQQRPQQPANPH